MARTKQFKGKTAVATHFKKKLTTKRSSLQNKDHREPSLHLSSASVDSSVKLSVSTNIYNSTSDPDSSVLKLTPLRSSVNLTHSDHEGTPRARKTFGSNARASKTPVRRSARLSEVNQVDESYVSGTSVSKLVAKTSIKAKKKKYVYDAPRIERRRKPGVLVLQEIRFYQKNADLLIPKLPFQRLIKEVISEVGKIEFRIQREAIEALREAAEIYLVNMFERCQLCAINAKRITILNRDLKLLSSLNVL